MSFSGDFVAATARSSGRRRSLDLWAACAGAVLALACAAVPASGQVAGPGLAGPTAGVAPTLREGVAALVNDEIISTYDLRQRMLLLIVTSGVQVTDQNVSQIQAEALRDLIDERLQM